MAIVCLALCALDASNLWDQRRQVYDGARLDSANLARSLTQHAGDTFRTADASIIGAVRRLEIDGISDASLVQLTKVMSARIGMFPSLFDWAVVGPDGRCLATATPSAAQDCGSIYQRNLEFHRTHNEGSFLGKPIRHDATWLIPLSHRVTRADGTFAGIVVARLSLDYFLHFYESFNIGEQGSILLATRDGTLLVRRPFVERNVGRDLHNSAFFREHVSRDVDGDVEITSSTDGVTRVNSYRHVAGYPLILSVALASDEILAPWYDEMRSRMVRTGALVMFIGVLGLLLTRHIRRQRELEEAYHQAADAFRLLAENSSDLIVKIGPDMSRQYVSPSSRTLLGYEPEELLGSSTDDIVYPDDKPVWEHVLGPSAHDTADDLQATYRVIRKDGRTIWVEVSRRSLPRNGGFVVGTRDVTRRKEAEEQLTEANTRLEQLAHQDGLTALANRRYFDETLQAEFARACRERTVLSLIMIDVDCFKLFNDNYGHPAGDHCLQQIARVLAELPGRPGDLVARYGGEEMSIILPNTPSAGALNVAERARLAVRGLAMPHERNAPKIVTISLGVASIIPESGIGDPEDLIKTADRALYHAKETGRDRAHHADDLDAPATSAARETPETRNAPLAVSSDDD